mmetsp:Transcript_55114/g.145487  ORF Transcript_55114/g.145487 Transcript_55114/m.145487 type:complete len:395 (-) Transcript_55114:1900-3084(-)
MTNTWCRLPSASLVLRKLLKLSEKPPPVPQISRVSVMCAFLRVRKLKMCACRFSRISPVTHGHCDAHAWQPSWAPSVWLLLRELCCMSSRVAGRMMAYVSSCDMPSLKSPSKLGKLLRYTCRAQLSDTKLSCDRKHRILASICTCIGTGGLRSSKQPRLSSWACVRPMRDRLRRSWLDTMPASSRRMCMLSKRFQHTPRSECHEHSSPMESTSSKYPSTVSETPAISLPKQRVEASVSRITLCARARTSSGLLRPTGWKISRGWSRPLTAMGSLRSKTTMSVDASHVSRSTSTPSPALHIRRAAMLTMDPIAHISRRPAHLLLPTKPEYPRPVVTPMLTFIPKRSRRPAWISMATRTARVASFSCGEKGGKPMIQMASRPLSSWMNCRSVPLRL